MNKNGLSRRGWMALAAATPVLGQKARALDGFVSILRAPDSVTAFLDNDHLALSRAGSAWSAHDIEVRVEPHGTKIPVTIEAPNAPLMRVRLRWSASVPERWRILNDHWERSYGDLEWRCMLGERVLPWHFLAFDGLTTHGFGVETGCATFAFWQVDPAGISLWLDVRNGGGPVKLGKRVLNAATVHVRRGVKGETPFVAAQQFAKALCPHPRLPAAPVYGSNNWYYAYGENCSAAAIETDSALLAELAPSGGNRPFMVIDDGWSVTNTAGPWDRGNSRFPDMAALASAMKNRGVRPGIWLRPLYTTAHLADGAQLLKKKTDRGILDPSIPENLEVVRQDMRRMVGWGFELIKHDYSSYDLTGRWGFAMNAELTDPGWHFADRSKTTAEVTLDLYRAIRESCGGALVIGCNTFGHLAAGLVELQRTGDDTSGRDFHRTRRMGVNTLAFRAPQHRTFFDLDADCAPVTSQLPWGLAARWMDLVARSGTALFVSADPKVLDTEKKDTIRRAFAIAAVSRRVAQPLDWMETTTPSRWRIDGVPVSFDWYGPEGGTPFPR